MTLNDIDKTILNHLQADSSVSIVELARKIGIDPAGLAETVRLHNGYVALPAYLATRRAGVPVVVHEGNPLPGLANRVGAINEIEFSEFVIKAQAVADNLNGDTVFPDMLEEVARGRELDQFASAHELRPNLCVVPNKGLRGPRWFTARQQSAQLRPQRCNGQGGHVGDVVGWQVFQAA